jgi:hypothetical protein
MTWGISGSGSTNPENLDPIKEIWNEAAKKVHEICPESFSASYWDDNGSVSIGNFEPTTEATSSPADDAAAPADTATPASGDTS